MGSRNASVKKALSYKSALLIIQRLGGGECLLHRGEFQKKEQREVTKQQMTLT